MSETDPKYQIISRVHVNQWNNKLRETVPGWQISAEWLSTGTILPVFVPDGAYTAENVDTLIRLAGGKDEQVHALGS